MVRERFPRDSKQSMNGLSGVGGRKGETHAAYDKVSNHMDMKKTGESEKNRGGEGKRTGKSEYIARHRAGKDIDLGRIH